MDSTLTKQKYHEDYLMKEVNFRYINCLKHLSYLEIQNPHLSDDNISRGFFLVPIIEIFESTFAVAEEASIDESLPGIAVVEEVTCGGDRAT